MMFANPDQTFLFADLSDFTALSEAYGDEAADLLGAWASNS
jgi:class 3 adenylate cyclase